MATTKIARKTKIERAAQARRSTQLRISGARSATQAYISRTPRLVTLRNNS